MYAIRSYYELISIVCQVDTQHFVAHKAHAQLHRAIFWYLESRWQGKVGQVNIWGLRKVFYWIPHPRLPHLHTSHQTLVNWRTFGSLPANNSRTVTGIEILMRFPTLFFQDESNGILFRSFWCTVRLQRLLGMQLTFCSLAQYRSKNFKMLQRRNFLWAKRNRMEKSYNFV